MTEFPLTGGCNCGAVRYEVTEPLPIASYCHCKRCQRRSGTSVSASAHPHGHGLAAVAVLGPQRRAAVAAKRLRQPGVGDVAADAILALHEHLPGR